MRYTCSSCKRVFYLETKTASPCPACGNMLALGEGDAPDAAEGAATEAPEQSEQASWLLGSDGVPVPPAAPVPSPIPAAAPVPPAPAPQAYAEPQEEAYEYEEGPAAPVGPAPAGPDVPAAPPPSAVPTLAEKLAAVGAQVEPTPQGGAKTIRLAAATQGFPQTVAIPATTPSGSRIFVITGISVLLVAGIAYALITYLGYKGPEVHYSKRDKTEQELDEEVSRLRGEKGVLEDKLGKAQADAVIAKESRQNVALELDALNEKLGKLTGRLGSRATAARLVVEAVRLTERRTGLSEALRKTDEALELDPDFRLAEQVRAQVLAASGLPKQALAAFRRANAAAKDAGEAGDAEALLRTGELCLADLDDRDRAFEYYEQAAKLASETPLGKIAKARLLQLSGETGRAVAMAEAARKASPQMALAPLVLGEIALAQALSSSGKERKVLIEKADGLLKEAGKLDPGSARVKLVRGKALLEKGRLARSPGFPIARLAALSRAERLLDDARRLKPKLADAHLALAELRLVEGSLRDAAIALSRAGEAVRLTERRTPEPLAVLARAHSANANPAEAVKVIGEALKLDPGNREYSQMKRRFEKEVRELRRRR